MRYRKLIYGGLGAGLIFCLILGWIIFYLQSNQGLKVVFFDIGQGDAILIQEGSNQILIDGGRDSDLLLERLGQFVPFWDRTIETIIITHPDSDHYGGLIGVFDNYKVASVVKTKMSSDYEKWRTLMDKIDKEKSVKIEAVQGVDIKFPNGAILQTVFPFERTVEFSKDKNGSSIVSRLVFGENSFLFTGDITKKEEYLLMKAGIDLKTDILKVAHHGSKYSTDKNFLNYIKAKEAVISVGKNNYGHPTQRVLNDLENKLIKIWRTDKSGNIVYSCKNTQEKCSSFAQ